MNKRCNIKSKICIILSLFSFLFIFLFQNFCFGTTGTTQNTEKLYEVYSAETAQIILDNIDKYGGNGDQETMTIEEIAALGGIFAKYAYTNNSSSNEVDYTVTSVQEFQEVNEYVFALLTIFGFDYGNGDVNHIFGNSSSAIFGQGYSYYGTSGLSYTHKPIEAILSGNSTDNPRRGNCNVTADIVYHAAGLAPVNDWLTCSTSTIQKYGGTKVTDVNNLQVSDIIMCYKDNGKR